MEGWPSGLRRTPGKRVGSNVSRVRIPFPPPVFWIALLIANFSFARTHSVKAHEAECYTETNKIRWPSIFQPSNYIDLSKSIL